MKAVFAALPIALLLASCVSRGPILTEYPTGHPANPGAIEGALAGPPSALANGGANLPPSTPQGADHDASHGHGTHAQAAFVCPMHPDVTSSEAGACPKCGMRLAPKSKDDEKPQDERPHAH